jgi:TatD DNase family protein
MLIETDSPYLSPDPFRGKSNEPANVKIVAEKIALIKDISFEDIANITTSNFKNLFFNE